MQPAGFVFDSPQVRVDGTQLTAKADAGTIKGTVLSGNIHVNNSKLVFDTCRCVPSCAVTIEENSAVDFMGNQNFSLSDVTVKNSSTAMFRFSTIIQAPRENASASSAASALFNVDSASSVSLNGSMLEAPKSKSAVEPRWRFDCRTRGRVSLKDTRILHAGTICTSEGCFPYHIPQPATGMLCANATTNVSGVCEGTKSSCSTCSQTVSINCAPQYLRFFKDLTTQKLNNSYAIDINIGSSHTMYTLSKGTVQLNGPLCVDDPAQKSTCWQPTIQTQGWRITGGTLNINRMRLKTAVVNHGQAKAIPMIRITKGTLNIRSCELLTVGENSRIYDDTGGGTAAKPVRSTIVHTTMTGSGGSGLAGKANCPGKFGCATVSSGRNSQLLLREVTLEFYCSSVHLNRWHQHQVCRRDAERHRRSVLQEAGKLLGNVQRKKQVLARSKQCNVQGRLRL